MFMVYNMYFILLLYCKINFFKMCGIVRESSPYIKGKGNLLTQGYNLRNLIIFDTIGIVDVLYLIISLV